MEQPCVKESHLGERQPYELRPYIQAEIHVEGFSHIEMELHP